MADTRLKLVTIMNYEPSQHHQRLCRMFLDSVLKHGAKSITILYEDHKPIVTAEQRRRAEIELLPCRSHDVGHDHFNLRFKLPNLAALKDSFLFLDSDIAVMDDLQPLWELRHAKPWIGINHQWIPQDRRTHRKPFLNSGVQLVSDPGFYDLKAILAVQNAVAPLRDGFKYAKYEMFACPGADQAVLYRYFQTIGYDYTHPEMTSAWNSCAGITQLRKVDGEWKARTTGSIQNDDVKIVHYWSQFKPWLIHCPMFAEVQLP